MKWHPLIIRFALALKYASTSAYCVVSNSGFISKNSDERWKYESRWVKIHTANGEMKIKQGLVFSKCTGEMVGFTNLGTVNEDLASITSEAAAEMGNHLLAKSMLVFMIRPIFKPWLSFPIPSYPASNLSGEKLYPVVMEVVEALELSNIAVIYIAVTSDRASPNHTFYKLCRLLIGLKVPYKTRNPYADRDIYIFVIHPT